MKLKNETDVENFIKAVNECSGSVWLESPYGDRFNLTPFQQEVPHF